VWVVAKMTIFEGEWSALGAVGAAVGRAIVARKRQRQLAAFARHLLSRARALLPPPHPGARNRSNRPVITLAVGAADFSTPRRKEAIPTTAIISFLASDPRFRVVLCSEDYSSQADPATHKRSNNGRRMMGPVRHSTRAEAKGPGRRTSRVTADKLDAVLASSFSKDTQREISLDGVVFKPRIIFFHRDMAACSNLMRKFLLHTIHSAAPADMRINPALPVYGEAVPAAPHPPLAPAASTAFTAPTAPTATAAPAAPTAPTAPTAPMTIAAHATAAHATAAAPAARAGQTTITRFFARPPPPASSSPN